MRAFISGQIGVNKGRYLKAMEEGKTTIGVQAADGPITLQIADVVQISGDIKGQIYARDFKMVDQSDMIIALVPELPSGKPALSSGVERELHHAFEGGKEVYVIWACNGMPSPFISETATRVFKRAAEAVEHFRGRGYIDDAREPIAGEPPSVAARPQPETVY